MTDVYIVSAVRTAIGRFQGGFSKESAVQLGTAAAKAAMERAGIKPEAVDEVIFGHVLQGGQGQNPARQVLVHAGVPTSRGAFTVNKVCGSGLKAVSLGVQAIRCGDADVVLAGGMESMTNAPYTLPGARAGLRLNDGVVKDMMVNDGLWDIYNDFHMGNTGELVSEKYGISKEEQDAFAAGSHQKAAAAISAGAFKDEIVPYEVKGRKGAVTVIDEDEGVRKDASPEGMARLKPVFKKDGTVTAGNASQISDGAAAVVIASEAKVKELGLTPLAKITGYATGGMDPEWVMMAPVEAVKNWEARSGLSRSDMDLMEFNEAFAVQGVALIRELQLDADKVNVNGGAVALGHPIGCSGTRVLVTLLYALKHRNLRKGLAVLCLGGGNAVAMSVEMQ